ncbi:recombinase family protein [Aeromonas hydrophila]|uniref:recombinase family protein n=1 Tax=Aeromonas hydrophila TaxID=644 RepID=UPI0035A3BACE
MAAFSYIRFSSKEQASGDSFARQMEASRDWCKQRGIELSEKNYADLGISAFREKTRASLADMLEAIELGSIREGDHIILENLDRLSRQGIDATQEIIKSILREGVKIVSLQDDLELDRSSLNDLVSVIRIALSADLAHKESLKKSERVAAAKQAQREQAKRGKAINKRLPYWLEKDGDGYQFNEGVDAVRLMIQLRTDGLGFHKIAMALNASEFKPRWADHWSDTTIRNILSSPALYGRYQFRDGDGVDDYYPALVSYAEFQAFQGSYTASAGGQEHHNHLFGLVRCGACGAAMSKKVSKRKVAGGLKHYKGWICTKMLSGACAQKIPMMDLDELVIKAVKRLKVSDPKKVSREANLLDREIDSKKARLSAIELELVSGSGSVSVLSAAASTIDKELKELLAQRKDSVRTSKDEIQALYGLRDDPERFNIALRRVVDRIKVFHKGDSTWHVAIHQRNGHLISVAAFRKSQRSPWEYMFGNTAEMAAIASQVNDEQFEWEVSGE